MAAETKKPVKTGKGKNPTPEECYNTFQGLRNEQRNLINKVSDIELDLNEHTIVIGTLKDLDGDRKCFRLVGGVLCEKTVKEILPVLTTNREQLEAVLESLNEQVAKKGKEINEYKEKHNIRIAGQDMIINATPETEESKSETPRTVIPVNPV